MVRIYGTNDSTSKPESEVSEVDTIQRPGRMALLASSCFWRRSREYLVKICEEAPCFWIRTVAPPLPPHAHIPQLSLVQHSIKQWSRNILAIVNTGITIFSSKSLAL